MDWLERTAEKAQPLSRKPVMPIAKRWEATRLRTTVIRKVKRPEGFGRWPTYVVSEDRFGLWLYSPKGTIYRGQSRSIIVECEVGQGSRDAGRPVMHLIPRTEWWMAAWCSEGAESLISVDLCTPPVMIDGEWTYIDLELDALAFADGRVEIDDEDEFAAACETGLIPTSEAIEARIAAQQIERCLRERTEPFGRTGWDRLNEALGMALPPITVLSDVPTA